MTGAWTLTDEGTFELNEPFKTHLMNAKHVASVAWQEAMYRYVADHTGYSREFVEDEFRKRVMRTEDMPVDIVDEFVIEALEGNL